jgi:hypothetical protein
VAGLSLETPRRLGRAESRQQRMMKWESTGNWLLTTGTMPNNTKQPNWLYCLRAPRATTTGAPLPQGDALVAYEN